MADEADLAHEAEQARLTAAIARNSTPGKRLTPVGSCHFCDEPSTQAKQLFCDSACATHWQREETLTRNAGLGGFFGLALG